MASSGKRIKFRNENGETLENTQEFNKNSPPANISANKTKKNKFSAGQSSKKRVKLVPNYKFKIGDLVTCIDPKNPANMSTFQIQQYLEIDNKNGTFDNIVRGKIAGGQSVTFNEKYCLLHKVTPPPPPPRSSSSLSASAKPFTFGKPLSSMESLSKQIKKCLQDYKNKVEPTPITTSGGKRKTRKRNHRMY